MYRHKLITILYFTLHFIYFILYTLVSCFSVHEERGEKQGWLSGKGFVRGGYLSGRGSVQLPSTRQWTIGFRRSITACVSSTMNMTRRAHEIRNVFCSSCSLSKKQNSRSCAQMQSFSTSMTVRYNEMCLVVSLLHITHCINLLEIVFMANKLPLLQDLYSNTLHLLDFRVTDGGQIMFRIRRILLSNAS